MSRKVGTDFTSCMQKYYNIEIQSEKSNKWIASILLYVCYTKCGMMDDTYMYLIIPTLSLFTQKPQINSE